MAFEPISVGSSPNDPSADTIRAAFSKLKALYDPFVGLAPTADKLPYWLDENTIALLDLTDEGKTLLSLANQAALNARVTGAAGVADGAVSATAKLADDIVTYAKMQNVSATDKLLARISSGAGDVEEVDFSDLAQTLLAQTTSRTFAKEAGMWHPLAGSAVAASHTGNTNETALATVNIPAGALGPNGRLRIWEQWTFTNNGNNKSLRTRLGGISGTQIYAAGFTTQIGYTQIISVMNRNSASSQLFNNVSGSSGGIGQAGGTWPNTGAVDTSVSQDLVISAALSNAADTVTLEGYQVDILYRS